MLNTVLAEPVTLVGVVACMAAAILLGVLTALLFLYRSRHSTGFVLAVAMLPLLVAVVIMMVNGNLGTGIAMAGAFALVRFRSFEGTAREITAVIMSMTLGLALGMGYIGIAALFFALAAVCILLLTKIDLGAALPQEKYLRITIPDNCDHNGLFDEVFAEYTTRAKLTRIRSVDMGTLFELYYEVVFKEPRVPKGFIDAIRARNANLDVVVSDMPERAML